MIVTESRARARPILLTPEFLPGEDPAGRLFVNDGMLLRAMRSGSFHRALLAGDRAEALQDAGMVATALTNYRVHGFDLVVRHEMISPVTYPFEWAGERLKAAALFFCDFAERLSAMGVGLKDAHGSNILFDYAHRPRFIDFGSLTPLSALRHAVHPEFNRYLLNPLYLMRAGAWREARHLIHLGGYETGSCRGGIDDEEVTSILEPGARAEYVERRRREALLRGAADWAALLEAYRAEISAIDLQPKESCWSTYYDVSQAYPTNQRFASLSPDESWQPKQHAVRQLFEDDSIQSVLDIGCSAGWFSRLAASMGKNVIALDCDEAALARLHREAVEQDLPICALLCDFAKMRSLYPPSGYQELTRFRGDLVLACAVIHHLVFRAGMGFASIVDTMYHLTGRTLVLEFLDETDDSIRAFRRERNVPWYSARNLRRELDRYFEHIEKVDSTGGWHRFLFVCTGRRSEPLPA